jgi:hypothetical protein
MPWLIFAGVALMTACAPATSRRDVEDVPAGAAGPRGPRTTLPAETDDPGPDGELRVVVGSVVRIPAPSLLVLATTDAPDGSGQLLIVARDTDFGGVVVIGQEVEVEGELQPYDRTRVSELLNGVLEPEALADYDGLYMLVLGP